jgi:homoserine O-acetyltransferase
MLSTLPQRTLRHAQLPPLRLDSGTVIQQPVIAYHLDGTLDTQRDNVIVVLHALTGSADAAGDWWSGVIGPGAALDTNQWAVLSPNLLGSCYGSTGPRELDRNFPHITTRDIARSVAALLDTLRLPRVALLTGGSLGGMVALEFAASFPGRADCAAIFAAPAAQPASAIAWSHVQRRALEVAGHEGLALARQVAMLTYRTPAGLAERFGRRRGEGEPFAVQDWLSAHGVRFNQRFNQASYLTLMNAMDTHDLSRGGTGASERLRNAGAHLVGVAIPGDVFCPAEDVVSWVRSSGATLRTITSPHGHDAFLIEKEHVSNILREALQAGNKS